MPPSKKLINDPNVTIVLDRPHRFAIGDIVRHTDDEAEDAREGLTVTALTLRNSVANVFVPTYVLVSRVDGSELEDVLCTRDLVLVRKVVCS